MTTRTNEEIESIKNTWYSTYSKSLESAIESDTSGDFKKWLLILLQGQRDESDVMDFRAQQVAANIIKSFDKKSGIDKFDAIRPLLIVNPATIHRVGEEFERLAGMSLEKGIEKHWSGDSKNLLLGVVALSKKLASSLTKFTMRPR